GTLAAMSDDIVRIESANTFPIGSVYRRVEAFHAGDGGPGPAKFEPSVVAHAGDGVRTLRIHRHVLPLLPEYAAIGLEILPGGVFGVPFDGVEQNHARVLLVLDQFEVGAFPVRRKIGGALLTGVLFE